MSTICLKCWYPKQRVIYIPSRKVSFIECSYSCIHCKNINKSDNLHFFGAFLIFKVTHHRQCCTYSMIRFSIAHDPSSNYNSDSSTKTRFPCYNYHWCIYPGWVCKCVYVCANVPDQGTLRLVIMITGESDHLTRWHVFAK